MVWSADDWLYTESRDAFPQRETAAPELLQHPFPPAPTREDFVRPVLPIEFQWLRSPWPDELFSLSARPGYLRLFGRETTGSLFRQALVARRQHAHCYSAATAVEFEPQYYQQQAGLICYYNGSKFHYLYVSTDEVIGKQIRVMTCHPELPDVFTAPIPIAEGVPVHLRVEVDYERLRFAFRVGGGWQWLPEQFDASILSDEAGPPTAPNFTGAFVGMCCQDTVGTAYPADFDYFEYRERDFSAAPLFF
jgi:xylan 1,4-beta-xylosidase